jgi:hypothetical protein
MKTLGWTLMVALAMTSAACDSKKDKDDTKSAGGEDDDGAKKSKGTSKSKDDGDSAGGRPKSKPDCKDDTNKRKDANGEVTSCLLASPQSFEGYACEGGKVAEFSKGVFKGCYLAEAKEVDGFTCKAGLSLYPSGKLRRCQITAAKKVAEGIDARPTDWVTLYETGTIKRLELASGPNKILGLPCKGYLNYFHENGKLKKCELSETATVDGQSVEVKDASVYVCFDDQGKRVADCKLLTGMTD